MFKVFYQEERSNKKSLFCFYPMEHTKQKSDKTNLIRLMKFDEFITSFHGLT